MCNNILQQKIKLTRRKQFARLGPWPRDYERNADQFYQQRAELCNFDVSFVRLKKSVMRPVTYTP